MDTEPLTSSLKASYIIRYSADCKFCSFQRYMKVNVVTLLQLGDAGT